MSGMIRTQIQIDELNYEALRDVHSRSIDRCHPGPGSSGPIARPREEFLIKRPLRFRFIGMVEERRKTCPSATTTISIERSAGDPDRHSAIYALADQADSNHSPPARIMRRPPGRRRGTRAPHVHPPRVVALLHHRHGLAVVSKCRRTSLPSNCGGGSQVHDDAVHRLRRSKRRARSLVDAVSFCVMEKEDIRTAFAFDVDSGRRIRIAVPASWQPGRVTRSPRTEFAPAPPPSPHQPMVAIRPLLRSMPSGPGVPNSATCRAELCTDQRRIRGDERAAPPGPRGVGGHGQQRTVRSEVDRATHPEPSGIGAAGIPPP